jgi:tetratricopeptide (TPR) repeat protein
MPRSLLLAVESQIEPNQPKDQAILKIKQALPGHMSNIYRSWVYSYSDEYRGSRDKSLLRKAGDSLNKLEARCRNDYRGHLIRAIVAFVLHRDVAQARQALEKCRQSGGPYWMYNEAFLLAYEKDLQGAYKLYQKALQAPSNDPTLPIQLEEFVQIVIDEEPELAHLYYCLGWINYRLKVDIEAAKRDFEHFLNGTTQADFPLQPDAVKQWLTAIEGMLELRGHHSKSSAAG